mgnify:CR=1 FL=1
MYYMRFHNDDGSSEEFEVHQGHIYCKCHVCGQEFAPSRIEFDKQFDSEEEYFFWNSCPDCSEKRKAENSIRESQMAHTKLAEELSRYLKKEITPEEIQQFMVDYKDAEYESIGAAIQERFGNGPSSDLKRKRQRKPQMA